MFVIFVVYHMRGFLSFTLIFFAALVWAQSTDEKLAAQFYENGEYEKAEGRFNQVIAIDKTYAEAYLYLADLHERQKLYKKAIADLENFKSLIDDPKKVNEVDDYILELSKNI
mgnify:CR=1 FL=1